MIVNTFRRHFDSIDGPEAATALLERWLDGIGTRVVGAILSTAWKVAEETAARSYVTGRLLLCESRMEPRSTHAYPSVSLDEAWLERSDLVPFIRNLLGRTRPEQLPEVFQQPSAEHLYSNADSQSGWPETLLKLNSTSNRVTPEWAPAVAPGLPPFQSWPQAVVDWVFERPAMYGTDVIFGNQLVVVMPDTRARARAIGRHEDGLAVEVEASDAERPFELQYVFSRSHGQLATGAVRFKGSASIPIGACPEATELEVYCLDLVAGAVSHNVFDWQQLRAAGATAKADDEGLGDDIARGERDTVEFKPFAHDSNKQNEIVKSVVAFANTDGGRVYVGVRDDGQPEGRGALKGAKLDTMLASLRKLIHDNIKPVPVADYRSAELAGEPICIVEVAPGPYVYSTHANEILVRKGSTNRRPDPTAELAPLLASRRAAPGAGQPGEPPDYF
jgi:hypothetical protein